MSDVAETCMAVLLAIAMDPKESGSTRVAAITRILEREIGRPAQPGLHPNGDDVVTLSDEELLRIAAGGRERDTPAAAEPG